MSLSRPTLSPGQSGTLDVTISDPVNETLSSVSLSFELYYWDSAGGSNGTLAATDTWAPSISYDGGPASLGVGGITLNNLPRGSTRDIELTIAVPSGCPSASYLIRTAANLTVSNGTVYRMLSRGYFSNAVWQSATVLPNGAPTLNLSRLNVSGILPETAVPVNSGTSQSWIWILLGISLVLGGVGGYLWIRSSAGPKERSGTSPSLRRKKAARAFGNKRAREGD